MVVGVGDENVRRVRPRDPLSVSQNTTRDNKIT